MQMKAIYLAVASSLALAACGSSNSDVATTSVTPQLTGTLSDSAVKGVSYAGASGPSGSTGASGEFQYVLGDKVSFKIGNVSLGTVDMGNSALGVQSGNRVVRPKDLAGVTDETDVKALAVAQVIQTAARS